MSSRHRAKSSRHPISRAALKRISLRTGHVGSHSGLVAGELRTQTKLFLEAVVRDTVTYSDHARRRTIKEDDVRHALERRTNLFSKKILGSPPNKRCESYEAHRRNSRRNRRTPTGGVIRPMRKASRGVSLSRRIKFYQRQHDCLHLPKASTQRLIREMGYDFRNGLRWSSGALNLLQYALELYIENLFKIAGHLAIHAKRKGRIQSKDVQAALTIEKLLEERPNARSRSLIYRP
jgi:histone H4